MCARFVLSLCLCLLLTTVPSHADDPGVVLLDEIIFDKLINKFQVALVKIDVAFPYGEKHDAFTAFAKEHNVLVKDLLIGDVHAKDYGDKDNWSLLKRFEINEKEMPAIVLIKPTEDPSKWVRYPAEKPVTGDNLKNFIRENTNLYIGLSGCDEELDKIAASFMEKFNRNEFVDVNRLIERTEELLATKTSDQVKLSLKKFKIKNFHSLLFFHRIKKWPPPTCK